MKSIHITVTQIEVLIAIAETGSFTAAGETLGLTQSAVSHVVANLEIILGVKLFERNRNGAVLTDIGANVLREAYATVAQLEHLQQMTDDYKGLKRGVLRLGSFTSVATQLLPYALKAFQNTHPNIEVMLRDGTDDEVKVWLREHVVVAPCDEFETLPLATDALYVVIPSTHTLSTFPQLSLQQIADEPFIMSGGGCESLIRSTFSAEVLTPNVKYTIRDIGTIFAFVRNGLGVTIVPSLSINASLEGLHIARLDPLVERHIAFAVRSMDSLSSLALQFIQQAQLLSAPEPS
jgi:molybdate transport repressor ModE-like protein